MIFSPLSEIPSVGRNIPYISSFFIFVILCIPTALVENFAGLLVLRFLQGFFGSPCLATGGASIGDLYSLIKLPYGLSLWAFAATCGPAFGPIISGFSVSFFKMPALPNCIPILILCTIRTDRVCSHRSQQRAGAGRSGKCSGWRARY